MSNTRVLYLDEPDEEEKPKKSAVRVKYIDEEPAKESKPKYPDLAPFLPFIVGKNVTTAPFKIAKDLGDTIFDKLKKTPNYLEKAKTEVPGLIQSYYEHPEHMLGQGYAGVAEGGMNAFNTPHDIINYATNRLNLFPEEWNKKVQMARMPEEETKQAIYERFGNPKYHGEELFRALNAHQSNIAGGAGLVKGILPYINPKNVTRAIKNLTPMEQAAQVAEQEHATALATEEQVKSAATRDVNTRDIDAMVFKKNEAQKKLTRLFTQLNEHPPQTLAEHTQANAELSKLMQEHEQAKIALDQAESEGIQNPDIKSGNPDVIISKINKKQRVLNQLNNDIKSGKPVTDEQLTQAKQDLDMAHQEYNQAKTQAETTVGAGTATPNALQLKINKNTGKINDLEDKLKTHQEIQNEVPVPEENNKFETKKVPNISDFAENEKRSQAYHENAQQQVANSENAIAHHVDQGADHKVNASRAMKKEITSVNNYWSNAYKALTEKLKNSKFNLTKRMPDLKEFFIETENPELINLLKKSPTVDDVSASDFMNKQKDFRDARYDLLQRAKTAPTAEMRQQLFDAYKQSEGVEKIINQTLEDGLGEHLPEYRRINEGYRKQVFPLRENPTANSILEGKPMSSDIAHELSGDVEGQDVLRELALRNEQVKRNIMGQQYNKAANDKAAFYNPDETVREYLNRMPELNKLIGRRESALSSANEAKANLERSTNIHNEAKANNAAIEKENAGIEKAKESHRIEQEKAAEKLRIDQEKARVAKEREREQQAKDIKSLQEENTLLGGIKKKLEVSSKNKETLEAEHKKLSDIKTHQDNINESINTISSDLETLNKHLNNIQSAKAKLDQIKLPGKVSARTGKAPNIEKMKQSVTDLQNKLVKLDEHIEKLGKAQKNTELKLQKKLEIQRSLDEARNLKKEAQRRLKVASTVITGLTAVHIYPNISDYLKNKKSNESRA